MTSRVTWRNRLPWNNGFYIVTGLPSGSPFYLRRTARSHPLYDSLSFLRRFFAVIKIKFFGNLFLIIFINNMICIVFI
ncbi:hypothetical protein FMK90_17690 [Klebsiella grimontii]|nr:hypothetical protein [Klebsiella grimontii]MBZ6569508.1 hypothetical protein [Klebsiella grimontii]MBZ7345539.1 hypothetical protein [Klebsiella grimontii]MBZ7366645.1 hypothetical protein [Klebsiella grimontii]MBZ7377958.1 hypothetical protein [Klebsiella grimontii]